MPSQRRSSGRATAERARREARELARTPVVDPYRRQLHDRGTTVAPAAPSNAARPNEPAQAINQPRFDSLVAEELHRTDSSLLPMPDRYSVGFRETAPRPAVAAGIISIVLAACAALFGFILFGAIALQHSLSDGPDRSFYQGADAANAMLAVVDFAAAIAGGLGGIALLTGRLTGRLAVTVFAWTMLGEAMFWLHGSRVTDAVPAIVSIASAAVLVLSYQASVTRWLGVLPVPQPE